MWTGGRGLRLTVLLAFLGFGFAWWGWVVGPTVDVDTGRLALSRGLGHVSYPGPVLWGASLAITVAALLSLLAFGLLAVYYGRNPVESEGKRRYKFPALALVYAGLLSGFVGSLCSR